MKKLLILAGLAVSLAANAANHESQNFLAVSAVYVTNTFNITNLTAAGSVGTNVAGTIYTNAGAQVVVTSAGTGAGRNLLKDVSVWARADGSPATTYVPMTNGASANGISEFSDATMSVTYSSGSGANSAVSFAIAAVPDGVHATGAIWTWGFTATASSTLATVVTNVPMGAFTGCKGLRLLRIVNADTDATSQVIVTEARINGFVP